ncbi:MAG: hypothetical protein AAFW87_13660 [Pseudomonadota bacterium]
MARLLSNLKAPNGGLKDVYSDAQITWYFTPKQLEEAALSRLVQVGSAVPDIARRAKREVRNKIKSVTATGPAFLGRPPTQSRFRYVFSRVAGHVRIDDQCPSLQQRYWDIGEDWAEVRRLEVQVNRMLDCLPSDCLISGRALAFLTRASGAQLVPQKLWVTEGTKLFDAELSFVLVCELPKELVVARRGVVPPYEIDSEARAKDALERLYTLEQFVDRKLTKETMVLVIAEVFEISRTAARTRVWPNANIGEWKRQSRPKLGSKISAQALRDALNEIKNT